ncbi:MAG: ASCH domain-containing protein [Anaerolineae bacterium]|nr:ASCH domain-containing protein [Anaerolineae bacterium]
MKTNPAIQAYWETYLKTLPADHPYHNATYTAWGFGDSPRMADELGALVKSGIKTATASLIWEYEFDGEALPQVGDISIILDGQDQPMCIIETTELRQQPFNQVEEQFAYDEGEGERTLAQWRKDHWAFFGRSCERIGRERSETMPVLCERFRVVYSK